MQETALNPPVINEVVGVHRNYLVLWRGNWLVKGQLIRAGQRVYVKHGDERVWVDTVKTAVKFTQRAREGQLRHEAINILQDRQELEDGTILFCPEGTKSSISASYAKYMKVAEQPLNIPERIDKIIRKWHLYPKITDFLRHGVLTISGISDVIDNNPANPEFDMYTRLKNRGIITDRDLPESVVVWMQSKNQKDVAKAVKLTMPDPTPPKNIPKPIPKRPAPETKEPEESAPPKRRKPSLQSRLPPIGITKITFGESLYSGIECAQ